MHLVWQGMRVSNAFAMLYKNGVLSMQTAGLNPKPLNPTHHAGLNTIVFRFRFRFRLGSALGSGLGVTQCVYAGTLALHSLTE